MTQPTLFSRYSPAFSGETFSADHDQERLTTQLHRVRTLMLDSKWRTLAEIAQLVKGSEAGVSARLRDLRRPVHGGYVIERKRRGDPKLGIHIYRLAPAVEDNA